eukprot:TRINITY_DN11512_c0_g2_i3.p1 TRINITY_DN11512_c0_g2~~TRINITY_DN11512_c0_g2_i3.p1  ORF type:complete len:512 (-),score=105.42 TRINITY_DN11512_c0_g2_i3:646-2181(-)
MATLDEQFLADLEELSDEEIEEAAEEEEEEEEGILVDLESLKYDSLEAIAKLQNTEKYKSTIQKVHQILEEQEEQRSTMDVDGQTLSHSNQNTDEQKMYDLIVACNSLIVDVDNEILLVYNFVKDHFRPRFHDLEQLVAHPVDYARVVLRIGNHDDLTEIDMSDILPSPSIMVITVQASTSMGNPLSKESLEKTEAGCELILKLDNDRQMILQFIERRMHKVAPNLTAAIGASVAAKLMGQAGGLQKLSQIPACNIMVLGKKVKLAAGYSSATVLPHQGIIYQTDLLSRVPPEDKQKAARLVSNKTALLARLDVMKQQKDGATGKRVREEMISKMEKWQELPPPKAPKPLPVPDGDPRKRRGGRRLRRQKELYGTTEFQRIANRMAFNKMEEEYIDGEDTIGMGMLGKEGSGRLKLHTQQAQRALKISKKVKERMAKSGAGGSGLGKRSYSGIQTSGLTSTLAYTDAEGIVLDNPEARMDVSGAQSAQTDGTQSYFSEFSGFRTVIKRQGL